MVVLFNFFNRKYKRFIELKECTEWTKVPTKDASTYNLKETK